ncbi:MAG TPA: hypothetical protein VHO47_02235 [Candidatus Babeliales bacterium]|nr:hypothetical protein [Candidatus Babeliales bacterium]
MIKRLFVVLILVFSGQIDAMVNNLAAELDMLSVRLAVLASELAGSQFVPPIIPINPAKEEVPALIKGQPALIQTNWIYQSGDIKQIEVLTQVDGANCGYHALKNGILILNAVMAGSNNQERNIYLNDLKSNSVYKNWFDNWANIIKKSREKSERKGTFDWLNGAEIELLIKSKIPEKIEHRSEFITVIDNPDWLTQQEFSKGQGLTEEIVNQVAAFQSQQDYFHVFVLANSREYQNQRGFIEGTWTHWISVAVNKVKGKSQFIILDSANHSRIGQQDVQTLIDTLQKGDIEQLKMRITFSPDLNTMLILLEYLEGKPSSYAGIPDDAFEGVIGRAKKIVKMAKQTTTADKKTSWFKSNSFKDFKNELVKLLERTKATIAQKKEFFTEPDEKRISTEAVLKELKG